MFSRSPIDWALLVLYFAVLGVVWLRARRASTRAVDYLVAGRAVTLPAFVATLVASWYGGILGVGEYSYRYGISNWTGSDTQVNTKAPSLTRLIVASSEYQFV